MKSWHIDLMLLIGAVVGLLPMLLGGDSVLPIVGPSNGPRAVVTIAESANATPERGAMLAELRNSTDWGDSIYRFYETDEAAAKKFVEAYPSGDSVHIGTLIDGKLGELLYSGPLPNEASKVVELWKENGGE